MRIHFIAIGGSIMHDLAITLQQQGHKISGSDDAFFDPSKSRLRAYGLLPEKEGWDPERITTDLDRVILGMHAKKENPELLRARELGVPVRSFPEFLAEASEKKQRIVIAGSHGKTSITAMVLHAMKAYGLGTDRVVGAQLEGYDGAVSLSDTAERILIEGDEYLSSPIDPKPKFLWYRPHIALISGIAWDHANVFPTFEDYLDAFRRFIRSIEKGGTLIHCSEDAELEKLLREEKREDLQCIPYGTHSHRNTEDGATLLSDQGEHPLRIFGSHNMQNLSGALGICRALGIPDKSFYEAMADFQGASLRLDRIHSNGKSVAYRDYAHAPSKVSATIEAVKERHPKLPLIACLELHTYSSLDPEFIDQYRGSTAKADASFILFDPEAAKRKGLQPLDPERVREAFGDPSLRVYTDMDELERELEEYVRAEDGDRVLLFMSSGPFQGKELGPMSERLLGKAQDG